MKSHKRNTSSLLADLKMSARAGSSGLVIPVGSPIFAILRIVATQNSRISAEDVSLLTEWRNRFVTHFLTEFEATTQRTASWLEHVVGPDPSKVLFMVDLLDGTTVGHVGIGFIDWANGYAEADAIVRGRDAPHGLMRLSLEAAIDWARNHLLINSFGVRVRSDNPALGFYLKIGFSETSRTPLRCIDQPDMRVWKEDSTYSQAAVFLVHMSYDGADERLNSID